MDENSEDLAEFDATLLAMRKRGIRPVILSNAHHGGPTPIIRTQHTVTADAAQLHRTITVNDASGLKAHYSGPQLDGHAPTMFIRTAPIQQIRWTQDRRLCRLPRTPLPSRYQPLYVLSEGD